MYGHGVWDTMPICTFTKWMLSSVMVMTFAEYECRTSAVHVVGGSLKVRFWMGFARLICAK